MWRHYIIRNGNMIERFYDGRLGYAIARIEP